MARPPLAIVTGASSGLGAAIAERLARPGVAVALIGRNADGLAATGAAVEARGGEAVVATLDLATDAFGTFLEREAAHRGAVSLYANAGVSAGPEEGALVETKADADRLIAVNLSATVASVRTALPYLLAAGKAGASARIGIVASIAAHFPTPDLAVYSATKAALVAYGHAIRPRLRTKGITVTVLCPGFVTTPMSARHHGDKPFEISAARAADVAVRAVERGVRQRTFPFPYAVGLAAWPLAPAVLKDRIAASFAAQIERDPRVR